MTTLKEVHEITEKLHKGKTVIHLNCAIDAAIVLANRVEELEAQRDELRAKVKSLTQMVRRREANIDAIERIARVSDKEKLEEKMHADLMNELEI